MLRTAALLGLALTALAGCGERDTFLAGERVPLREAASAPQDGARAISLPAAVNRAAWTHRASGPDHVMPHAAFAAAPSLLFSADIGRGADRRSAITAEPVIADGRVFAVDSRGRVSAHSTSGAPLWTASLVPLGENAINATGGGLAVEGATLVATSGFGEVAALDASSGRRIWTQDIGAPAGGPTISGGRVYVVGRDATAWAIELGNGRVAWTEAGAPGQAGYVGGAAPAVAGDTIVMPYGSRELAALFPAGTRRWSASLAGSRAGAVYAQFGDITADPVIAGGRVYAGSPTGRTDAFDLESGRQIWSATEGALSPVVLAGGSVFAVSDQAELVRLDATDGARVWGTELPYLRGSGGFLGFGGQRGVTAHYGPVLAGGRLWVASTDGQLRGFSPESGRLTAEVPLPGGAATDPVVVGGVLYVVSRDGRLLAFG